MHHGDSAASSGQLLTTASVPRRRRTTIVGVSSGHRGRTGRQPPFHTAIVFVVEPSPVNAARPQRRRHRADDRVDPGVQRRRCFAPAAALCTAAVHVDAVCVFFLSFLLVGDAPVLHCITV